MKKKLIIGLCIALFLASSALASPTLPVDTFLVDLGLAANEAGFSPSDFGPPQPMAGSGGYWGGIAGVENFDPLTTTPSHDRLLRTIYEPGGNPWATLTFPVAVGEVYVKHLQGIAGAQDGFNVSASSDGITWHDWGNYVGIASTTEIWRGDTFSGCPGTILKFTATGLPWSGQGTWGQVGFDRVCATAAVPAPGALFLGGVGAGFIGWLRRRRFLFMRN
jgi:hypothetical protein